MQYKCVIIKKKRVTVNSQNYCLFDNSFKECGEKTKFNLMPIESKRGPIFSLFIH